MIIIDRIIAKAVQLAIMPLLDPLFLPGVFGFRPSRSIQGMLLAIEKAAMEYDSLGYRPGRHPRRLRQRAHRRRHAGLPPARQRRGPALAHRNPAEGRRRPDRTMGIDQGNAVSPVALLLRLHHVLEPAAAVHTAPQTRTTRPGSSSTPTTWCTSAGA